MKAFPHYVQSVSVEDFQRATRAISALRAEDRQRVRRAAQGPVVDLALYREEVQDARDPAVSFIAVAREFEPDLDKVWSIVWRLQFVFSFITKRRFRQYRRDRFDGAIDVSETFIKAVCALRMTSRLLNRRRIKRLKFALLRELKRQERE